jgi:ABC-type lipoprotein export system ATPase subunit/GNAT superfamily N-acetyltransferase
MKTVKVIQDEITKTLSQSFDYEFDGTTKFNPPHLPSVPQEYGIGLIVGASGSGKSTLLEMFGKEENIVWNPNLAICSQFNNADEAEERLSSVGFNSIPSWMRPYHVLSTGEKFRADLARKLKDNAIIDEFTSVVDRTVAKSCSHAVRRYVDKQNLKNIIFATCHYDIIEWLQPDWVFDTATNRLTVGRGSVRRPNIQLEILPCSIETWKMFCNHHYLSGNINKSSRCWIAIWEGKVVGFTAVITLPSGSLTNAWKGHRTVILPDYQGLGIGVRLSDAIGELHIQNGLKYFSKTGHKRLGEYRNNKKCWRPTTHNMEDRSKQYARSIKNKSNTFYSKDLMEKHANRICYCHEYIGN